jgi:hypothetical protein
MSLLRCLVFCRPETRSRVLGMSAEPRTSCGSRTRESAQNRPALCNSDTIFELYFAAQQSDCIQVQGGTVGSSNHAQFHLSPDARCSRGRHSGHAYRRAAGASRRPSLGSTRALTSLLPEIPFRRSTSHDRSSYRSEHPSGHRPLLRGPCGHRVGYCPWLDRAAQGGKGHTRASGQNLTLGTHTKTNIGTAGDVACLP